MQAEGELRTSTLFHDISLAGDIDEFLGEYRSSLNSPPFYLYLNQLCEKRNLIPAKVILRSGIHRTYGHQIFNGTRKPSRDKVLQIALGLELDVTQTQKLLHIACAATLYPKFIRDAVVVYALEKRMGVIDVQNILCALNLTLLGGAERDE